MKISTNEALCAFVPPFMRYLREGLAKVNLTTARFQILEALAGGHVLSMVELAQRLSVTKRNITTLVDGLEKDGLVTRSPHPTDRRSKLVQLTQSGEQVFVQASKVQRAHLDRLLSQLEPETRQALTIGLSRLTEELRRSGAEG